MKNLKTLILILFTTSIIAQNNIGKPYIEVVGISETEIVPNEIYLDICLKERFEKGKKTSIEFLENQLKITLNEIGIPKENLSISDMNNILAKTGLWKKEILSSTNYGLKVEGVTKLKKLFEKFKQFKVFSVNISKVTHSNLIELRKENRIKAIKAGKEKASYLLSAVGNQIGNLLIVREMDKPIENATTSNNIRIRGYSSNYKTTSIGSIGYGINNVPIQFKKIKITSSMYVKFSIQ